MHVGAISSHNNQHIPIADLCPTMRHVSYLVHCTWFTVPPKRVLHATCFLAVKFTHFETTGKMQDDGSRGHCKCLPA